MASNACIRKKTPKVNNLSFPFRKLAKEEQSKSKKAEKKRK